MSPAETPPSGAPLAESAAAGSGGRPELRLCGDVDLASEQMWRDRGEALLADPAVAEVVVDMGDVSFLDSRGMAMLVHLYTQLVQRGGALVLTRVPDRVAKALVVAGLDELFELPPG